MLFVFAVSAFAQISFWIAIWIGVRRAAGDTDDAGGMRAGEPRPVSVVIAARDADETLPELLDTLARQDHPVFEVVVVDDGSHDRSAELVAGLSDRDPRFRVVGNPIDRRGKKGAVSTGIHEARHNLIALADADCRPRPGWLSAVERAHRGDTVIVAGYGPYARSRSVLNTIVRYETLATAMMTAGTIGLGYPYMAVGRNLSYPKEIFENLRNQARGQDLLSGEDDLFIQEASRAGFGVRYMLDPESFVVSNAPESFRSWIHQKRRHLSTSRSYRISVIALLAAFHGSSMMCWIAPLAVGWPGVLFLAAKFAVQLPVTASAASRFGEKGLVACLPLLDLAWLVMLLAVTPIGVLFPPRKW